MRKSIGIIRDFYENNTQFLLFSAVYYGIIIFLAWYLNIWEDEAYSLHTSSNSLSYAINQSIDFEAQPPVYFILLTIWRSVNGSILWARLFNVFFIFLAQFFIFRFFNKNYQKNISNFSVFLFLLNPLIIFTLLEIRLFAFLIFICVSAILYFHETYYANKVSYLDRILFILISIIGLFTQLLFGFLLFILAVTLLIDRKWKSLWLYMIDMVIPLVLLSLYFPQILNSIDIQNSLVLETENAFIENIWIGLIELFDRLLTYMLPVKFSFLSSWIPHIIFLVLLVVSLNYAKLKKEIRVLIPHIVLVSGIWLFFLALHLKFGFQSILYKYTIVLFPPVFFLFIILLNYIKPKLLNYGFIFIIVFYLIRDIQDYRGLYKVNDFRALSAYLEKIENKDEPIFIYRNINSEVISFYYNGVNKISPLPRVIAYDRKFGPEQWIISEQDLNLLSKRVNNKIFYVVIIDDKSLLGFMESKRKLTDFLNTNFKNLQVKTFTSRLHLYKFSGQSVL